MDALTVELGDRSYSICIGNGLIREAARYLHEAGITPEQKVFIITDEHVASLHLQPLETTLKQSGYRTAHSVVSAGESAKDIRVYYELMTEALTFGMDRSSVFLALGGGVVGDLAGFVAATYMRGVPFVQMPTTLLAHDSSVGGKVAVNHHLGKNMIGAFHQPAAVLYDIDTLHTLPRREIAAGFAEVVKHGLIWDESFVEWLDQHTGSLNELEPVALTEAIRRACAIKAAVVSRDEKENGLRAILNLGHTFGHAFEALSGYETIIHGEAVAMGMTAAARLSEEMGLARDVADKTEDLLQRFGLPTRCPAHLNEETVIETMRRDKKGQGGRLVMVLPRGIGEVDIVRGVDEQRVAEVLNACKGRGST